MAKFTKGEFQKASARDVASNPITTTVVNVAQPRYNQSGKRKK
jgi:hypothetical protein